MAPFLSRALSNPETFSTRQNGCCSKFTVYSLFSLFVSRIWGWFQNTIETIKSARKVRIHPDENPQQEQHIHIDIKKPISEWQYPSKESVCEIVDKREVEEHYEWLIKILKDGNQGDVRYRYNILIKEIWNLVFQSQRSDSFLIALTERFFPTSSTITESLISENCFEQTCSFDLKNPSSCEPDGFVGETIGENIQETGETSPNQPKETKKSSQTQCQKDIKSVQKNIICKKDDQVYIESELSREVAEKQSRENAVGQNDMVYKASYVNHSEKPDIVSVSGDGKNSNSDPNVQDGTQANLQTENGGNLSLGTAPGNGEGYFGNGNNGDDRDNPKKTTISIPKGHYEETPDKSVEISECQTKPMQQFSSTANLVSPNTGEPIISDTDIHTGNIPINCPDVINHVWSPITTTTPVSHEVRDESQEIIHPLNTDVLGVDENGGYKEGHDFVSIRNVGSGAFGECDLCYDTRTIKELVRKQVKNPENFNEINTWRMLNTSPNYGFIVELYGAMINRDILSMFMEAMHGTFQDISDNHEILQLSEQEVIALIKPVLLSLVFIHDKGIVHVDVKNQNIFFKKDSFEIKLGDFGLSVLLHGELYIPNNKVCGTMNYMAKECIRSEPFGRSSDIWSVGCVIIHLLTGRIPWFGYERLQIMFKVGSGGTPEIPSTCSDDVKQLLEMIFQTEKTERPTARELLCLPMFGNESDDSLDPVLIDVFDRISSVSDQDVTNMSYHHQMSVSDHDASITEIFVGGSAPMSLSGPHEIIDEPVNPAALETKEEESESSNGTMYRNTANSWQFPEIAITDEEMGD